MADELRDVIDPDVVTGISWPHYYIASGVRRAVAAREVGHSDIAANIVEPGKADVLVRIALEQLHSPKAIILRDLRYIQVEVATRAGKRITPIEVQPLGLLGQLPTVKLSLVQFR